PIYGLAVIGLVRPDQVLTNRGARPGDVLLLTKSLGVGVLSAAFKQDRLDKEGYRLLKETTTRLNSFGAELAGRAGVHAVTDVTGFGLLGHALEMARGAGATVELTSRPPVLGDALRLLEEGVRTGASARNWAAYGHEVDGLEAGVVRDLLTDPQTSGGLLIAVAEAEVSALQALARINGCGALPVGRVVDGPARVQVVA
ncbi:selenide, water dikinase SelD, partial [Brevundimonas sp. Root1423]|uniref:selenide, water dikinase SelD n=2 Tax=unclassified Brevundimonas TaxID=2622653 RepID=UPI000A985C6C